MSHVELWADMGGANNWSRDLGFVRVQVSGNYKGGARAH